MDHIAKLIKTDPKARNIQSPCSAGRVSQSKFLSPCRRVGLKRNTSNKFVLKFKEIDPLNTGITSPGDNLVYSTDTANEIVEQETKREQEEDSGKKNFILQTANELDNNENNNDKNKNNNDTNMETSDDSEICSTTNDDHLEIATSVENTMYRIDETNDFDNSETIHGNKIIKNIKHTKSSVQDINTECSTRNKLGSSKTLQISTCKSNTNKVTKENSKRNEDFSKNKPNYKPTLDLNISKNKQNHSSENSRLNTSSPDLMKMKKCNINVRTNDSDKTRLQDLPAEVKISTNVEDILDNKCDIEDDISNKIVCKEMEISTNSIVKTDDIDILNHTKYEEKVTNFSDDMKKDKFVETPTSSVSNYENINISSEITNNNNSRFCDSINTSSSVNETFNIVSNSNNSNGSQIKQLKIINSSEVDRFVRIEDSSEITDTSCCKKERKRLTKRFKNPMKQFDVKKIKLDIDQTKAEGLGETQAVGLSETIETQAVGLSETRAVGLSETDKTQAVRLKNIRRRIAEKEKKIADMKSTIANSTKHNLDELDSLISKWRTGCQEALNELLAEIRRRGKDNYNMCNLLGELNIPHDLVRYNELEEDFL